MDRLEHALKYANARQLARKGSNFVYVILCVDFVKIGIAKHPEERMMQMQIGCPYQLKIIAKYQTQAALEDEQRLHALLRKFHHRGEWFKIPDSLLAIMVRASSVADLFGDNVPPKQMRS